MRMPGMTLTLTLTMKILLGFILGIAAGIFFGDLVSAMKPVGEAFIKIWQITILPSVALSLIVGIGSLRRDTAKAIAVKAFLILLLFWVICVIGYFSFQLAFPPRIEASFFSTQELAQETGIDFIDQFIPVNPFLSLSDGIIPATVLFCLFLGFALMLDDGKGPVMNILRSLLRALDRMTHIIAKTFPYGIFVITAVMAGTLTVEGFLELQVFLVTLAAAAILLGLVVMPLLVTCFTTFHYRGILAASSRAMLLAFSTGTEFITLPLISEAVENLFRGRPGNPDTDYAGGSAHSGISGDSDGSSSPGNSGTSGQDGDPAPGAGHRGGVNFAGDQDSSTRSVYGPGRNGDPVPGAGPGSGANFAGDRDFFTRSEQGPGRNGDPVPGVGPGSGANFAGARDSSTRSEQGPGRLECQVPGTGHGSGKNCTCDRTSASQCACGPDRIESPVPGTGHESGKNCGGDKKPAAKNGHGSGRDGEQEHDAATKDVRSFSEILVPVAYTFPLLGGLVPFLFILVVAWLYQNPLDLAEQIQLIVVGIPNFFGSSKLSVIALLNLMNLPADAYNLYISSGILRQAFVAPLSVISIFAFTTITIAYTTHQAKFRWKRAAFSIVTVLVLGAILIAGLHAGFSQMLAGTYHGSDQISWMGLPPDQEGRRLDSVVNTTVYLHKEDVPVLAPPPPGPRDEIRTIRERGALRVGYNQNNVPFVFFNGKGELVGYDVEMAYDLARNLNVSRIEFVPITGTTLAQSLDSGYCDIGMAAVAVTMDRLGQMRFTDPTVSVHLAFVVPDGKREEFTRLVNVRKIKDVRIAAYNNTVMLNVAKQLLPDATIVPIDSGEEVFEQHRADALMVPAEEGYTLTLIYPFYDVAIIEPYDSFQMMYAYPIAKESSDSYLLALNYWIRMEKEYGMLDKKYDYWVLGNVPGSTEPRWSVVRNVLHLVN